MQLRNGKSIAKESSTDSMSSVKNLTENIKTQTCYPGSPRFWMFDKIQKSKCKSDHYDLTNIVPSTKPRELMGVNSLGLQRVYPKLDPAPHLLENNWTTPQQYARNRGRLYGKGFYWKFIDSDNYNVDNDPEFVEYFKIAYDEEFAKKDQEYIDPFDENGNLVCIPDHPDGLSKPGFYWKPVPGKKYDLWDSYQQTEID